MVFHRYSGCRKVKKYGDWCGKRDRTAPKRRKRNREVCCGAHCGVCHYSTCPVWNCICDAEAAAGCGDDGASDPCGLCSFMFCRRLVRRTAGRTAEVPAGTAGGSSVFCRSVSDFRDGRTGDSVRSGQRRTCMPSVRSQWHAWRHTGLKTAEKLFLFNYKMV